METLDLISSLQEIQKVEEKLTITPSETLRQIHNGSFYTKMSLASTTNQTHEKKGSTVLDF